MKLNKFLDYLNDESEEFPLSTDEIEVLLRVGGNDLLDVQSFSRPANGRTLMINLVETK